MSLYKEDTKLTKRMKNTKGEKIKKGKDIFPFLLTLSFFSS